MSDDKARREYELDAFGRKAVEEGFGVAPDAFNAEDNPLTQPYESMKEVLGSHRFEIAYDEAHYRNAGEQAVDFTFRMVLAKALRCFGYSIQPMQIDVETLKGETLKSALKIVEKMRYLEMQTNDPWLEDYVFGEPRLESNPTVRATANLDGDVEFSHVNEHMEFGEGVAEGLRAMEPFVGKFARDLSLSQSKDIQHPAVAEIRAQMSGGRAH